MTETLKLVALDSTPNAQPTTLELAWLAGLIDGEGSITISKKGPGTTGTTGAFTLRVGVAMTGRPAIEAAARIGGGRPVRSYQYSRNPAHKIAYMTHWTNARAGRILAALLPYLVLKRRQAEIGIEYASTIMDPSRRGQRSMLSQEVRAKREALRFEMQILNRKGTYQ